MLKTLKITTFLAALLAVGCVGALGYYAFKKDTVAIETLERKGQVEIFIASAKTPKQDDTTKDSPLVKQAEKFALRIDPPPPPPPPPRDITTAKISTKTEDRIPPPSAKFTLSGTVVSANPDYSIALLNTTAKGLRWFRQGEKIAHLTIEQIGEGFIIINDGTKTYEMQTPEKTRVSLLKGDPDNPYSKTKTPKPVSKEMTSTKDAVTATATPKSQVIREVVQTSTGEVAIVERKVAPLPTSDAIKENIDFLEKIANNPESMGMSKEEAAQLGDMTEFIEQLNTELSHAQKREHKEKVPTKAAEPTEPNQTSDNKPKVQRSRPRRTRTR